MGKLNTQTKQIADEVMAYVNDKTRDTVASRKVRTLLEKVGRDATRKNICTVETAIPLTDVQVREIQTAVEKKFGRALEIVTRVKTSLMGGMRISVDDWILDTTLKNQLDTLKSSLVEL